MKIGFSALFIAQFGTFGADLFSARIVNIKYINHLSGI